MSLRFCDSFSHYSYNDLLAGYKWTSILGTSLTLANSALIPGAGRFGGGIFRLFNNVQSSINKTLDNQATWIIGFAFKYSGGGYINISSGMGLCSLYDAGSPQCDLRLMPDNTLAVTHSGTIPTGGKSNFSLQQGVWYFIEWKVTISNSISANTCQVNINGTQVLNVTTGQSIRSTSNNTANQILLGTYNNLNPNLATIISDYGDLYICDGTGSTNNTFLGDVKVECRFPSATGNNTAWVANGGAAAYNCVNEQTPNGDLNFISSASTNDISTFTLFPLISTPTTIFGIQMIHCSRKTDAGARQIADELRSGSTNFVGTTVNLSSSYAYYSTIYETDPNTSAAWTGTNANALEIGVKEIT